MPAASELRVRVHGVSGPRVVVLHGGPGAPGSAGTLARGLAERFRVFEPWQRGSGDQALTVTRHVVDLHALLAARGLLPRPMLVGESWGAMLALAYAAAHPREVGPLVLIGCGTFDRQARTRLQQILDERLDPQLRARLERLPQDYPDPAEQLRRRLELTRGLYHFDVLSEEADSETPPFDERAHAETWADMVRLQDEGVYPAAFAAVGTPVLMLHGTWDPHPGRMIRAGLSPYLPQLEYREWADCGHSPWLERSVRTEFFKVLGDWLERHAAPDERTAP